MCDGGSCQEHRGINATEFHQPLISCNTDQEICLHKILDTITDMTGPLSSRKQYLKPINQYFDRNYQTLDQYKETGEFEKILQEFVTLDSVRAAIRQAEKLRMRKQENGIKWTEYSGFRFYKDNPDTTVDQVVRIIFEACGIPLV